MRAKQAINAMSMIAREMTMEVMEGRVLGRCCEIRRGDGRCCVSTESDIMTC